MVKPIMKDIFFLGQKSEPATKADLQVEYLDMNWKKQKLKLDGWTAQICQHELDHLEGILI